MARGRGFAPKEPKQRKPRERTPDLIPLITGLTTKEEAAALPAPKNSPPMSNFKNLGGISGRKSN